MFMPTNALGRFLGKAGPYLLFVDLFYNEDLRPRRPYKVVLLPVKDRLSWSITLEEDASNPEKIEKLYNSLKKPEDLRKLIRGKPTLRKYLFEKYKELMKGLFKPTEFIAWDL